MYARSQTNYNTRAVHARTREAIQSEEACTSLRPASPPDSALRAALAALAASRSVISRPGREPTHPLRGTRLVSLRRVHEDAR